MGIFEFSDDPNSLRASTCAEFTLQISSESFKPFSRYDSEKFVKQHFEKKG